MSEQLFDLDEEERAILYAHRQRKQQERDRLALRLKLLDLAHRYEAWLQANGRGSSFSTFVNEFGCSEPEGNKLYQQVQAIRALLQYSERGLLALVLTHQDQAPNRQHQCQPAKALRSRVSAASLANWKGCCRE